MTELVVVAIWQRCACDPLCSGFDAELPEGPVAEIISADEVMQFHGVDDRAEVPQVPTPALPEYTAMCDQVGFTGLYTSAALSLAAAALHSYGYLLGSRLHTLLGHTRSAAKALASGPLSAPGALYSSASLALHLRPLPDPGSASSRRLSLPASSGPHSSSSGRSAIGADGLC